MIKILIISIAAYFIFRFVVRFLLPFVKLVRMTHRSVNEVKRKFDQAAASNTKKKKGAIKTNQTDGEYIEYEEVS